MGCDELRHLLNMYGEEHDLANSFIASHIRSCSVCARGLKDLAQAIVLEDPLTCEECLARLPEYYEATHPIYPLGGMSDAEMAEEVLHLGHCVSCREQYEILVLIARIEEDD
jgi:hypothetical protein